MTAVGGSIEAVSLSGREFPVAAEATANRKLGGSTNEVKMNGNQTTARLIKVSTAWVNCISSIIADVIDDAAM